MTQIARNIQVQQTGRACSLTPKTRHVGIKSLIGLLFFAAFFMGATMSSHATFSITASPSSVCPGDQITVTIVEDCMDPDNEWYYGSLDPNNITDWTCTDFNLETYTATFVGHYTAQNSDAGNQLTWTYEDMCYSPSSTSPITVVGADSVTRSPDYADNWVGNSITYTVVLKPSGATSPDTITWTGDVTSGATGTTTSKSYTDTGTKTATAKVGTSPASASVTIHKLISTCDANCPTPKVGRTDLGIGETVTLTADPSVSVYHWGLTSAGHSSISGGGFTASQTGGESPTVTAQLGDASGPTTTISYNIKAPTGYYYTGIGALGPNLPPLGPPNNTMIVSMYLQGLLQPTSVSFAKATLHENVANTSATFPNPPPNGTKVTMIGGTFALGIQDCSTGYAMDLLATQPLPITLMNGAASTVTETFAITYDYVNADGAKVQFGGSSCHHDFCYKPDGSTYVNAVAASTVSTSSHPQGPYQ